MTQTQPREPVRWIAECKNPFCGFGIDASEADARPRVERLVHGRALVHESTGETHDVDVWHEPQSSTERPRDGGMRLCGELESEDELQAWLADFFEASGWTAIREVSPAGSNYSADLLVEHDEYGRIGIETKYFHRDGGSKVARAHHQITRKYRGQKYLGERVDLWAYCPYYWGYESPDYVEQRHEQQSIATVSRELFCCHGIGYMNLNRPVLLIDYGYSSGDTKIPVGFAADSEYADSHRERFDGYARDVDIGRIRDGVSRKMEQYDYQ